MLPISAPAKRIQGESVIVAAVAAIEQDWHFVSVDLFCLQQEIWKGVSYERRMLSLIPWAIGLLDWLLISDRFIRVQFGLLESSCSGISDGASIVSAQVIAGDQLLPLSKPPLLWGGFSWSMTTLTAAAQSNFLTSCCGQPTSVNRPRQLRCARAKCCNASSHRFRRLVLRRSMVSETHRA